MASVSPQVVILGAGRSVRGATPSALVDIDEHGRVLDWLLDAFAVLDAPEVVFVGGFRAEDVLARYRALRVVFNRTWAETGPVESLALVDLDPFRDAYICYSDVVFRRRAVEALSAAPSGVAIAVDTRWRKRYDGRGPEDLDRAEKVRIADGVVTAVGSTVPIDAADAEFAGVVRLSPQAVAAALRAIGGGSLAPTAALPALIEEIRASGVPVHAVDLGGDWAELDARQDLARFVLGTKAESLERLRPMDHGARIDSMVAFTRSDWVSARDAMIARIHQELPDAALIVRSSALSEDGWGASGAGQHESIADVAPSPAPLRSAVDAVFASYHDPQPEDQVLVQAMVRNVAMSGVVMTRTHSVGAPYFVIEFDESADRTDVVTSGGAARSVMCLRGAELRNDLPAGIAGVLSAVQKIEGLVGHDSLDIEFAVTSAGDVHILQVRPIATGSRSIPVDDDAIARAVHNVATFVDHRIGPSSTLIGATTRFSVMTDWNPAEIIGTTPSALATSLYRFLVTDEVWARQRAEYGYRDVRPCGLLVELAGHPYIDVRACFNSFVPASIPDPLAARLVDDQLARLAATPALHDKVEFDVVLTCLDPTFDRRARELAAAGFDDSEIEIVRVALRDLTRVAFARLHDDFAQLDALRVRVDGLDRSGSPISVAAARLDLVRRVGTPVFAHLARSAFVATAFLRGLVERGVVTADRVDEFLATTETVFGRLQRDAAAVGTGALAWADFVDRYAHLRPGAYDITVPTYGTAPEAYLRPLVALPSSDPPSSDPPSSEIVSGEFAWTDREHAGIAAVLTELELPISVVEFAGFVRCSIAGREEAKFVFTRPLSEALEALAAAGGELGFSRDELAHVRIEDLLRLGDALDDPAGFLRRRVEEGIEARHVTQGVALPSQIATTADVTCFEQADAEPNFVGRASVEAPAVASPDGPGVDVVGRIVLIPSADPGYDWLLARGIAGLITMFGGANSHMAVRAAECAIPAAIGIGETRFDVLARAAIVRLDCGARTITVVR